MIPDTARLADLPRVCLQESEEIPPDYTRLFNSRLFSISTAAVPRAITAGRQLGLKHEPLRLITPQFETPLPPLQVNRVALSGRPASLKKTHRKICDCVLGCKQSALLTEPAGGGVPSPVPQPAGPPAGAFRPRRGFLQ